MHNSHTYCKKKPTYESTFFWASFHTSFKEKTMKTHEIQTKAMDAFLIKDYRLALNYFNLHLKEDKTNTDSLFYRAWCKDHLNDHQGAIQDYRKIICLYDERPCFNSLSMVYNNMAYGYYKLHDFDKAERLVEIAIKMDAGNFNALTTKGEIYHSMLMYEKAIQLYEEAIEMEKKSYRGHRIERDGLLWILYKKADALSKVGREVEANETRRYLKRLGYKGQYYYSDKINLN